MQTVMAKIVEWGKDLPYWEQATLDKIIYGEEFTEEAYVQILQLLLEDEGLAKKKTTRDIPRFYQQVSSPTTSACLTRLKRIANLHNVNALASNQTLEFNPQLTAIYGENRSGKSGYARVLGSAGFTRGDREVLPDITKPNSSADPISADIEFMMNGVGQSIHYKIDRPCPELSSFYVFDSTSVRVHMLEKNEFSFSPVGFGYLKRLSDETDQIRARLARKVEYCCQPCEYVAFFQGDTSSSHSTTASLMKTDRADQYELIYHYINEPKVDSVETMNIHHGTSCMEFSTTERMEGEYFSGRGRVNYGNINFIKEQNEQS